MQVYSGGISSYALLAMLMAMLRVNKIVLMFKFEILATGRCVVASAWHLWKHTNKKRVTLFETSLFAVTLGF